MAANGALQSQSRLGPFTPVPGWRPLLKSYRQLKGKSWLSKEEVQQLMTENNMEAETLLQALVVPAAEIALPYLSGYFVGAAALGNSGRIFFGANLEFPHGGNLSSSVHAEQCLTANLLRQKEESVVLIAISAPPCGHCRQFFSEYACADSLKIIFGPPPGNVYRLDSLLPQRFGPQDLLEDKDQPLLLQPQQHLLQWTQRAEDRLASLSSELQQAANSCLEAAKGSYTPYTRCPSSVCLISDRGLHIGSIVESAAHSPTFQPLQAAFSMGMLDGLMDYGQVHHVILVELETAPLQQEALVRALLKSVSPTAVITVLGVQYESA